MYIFPKDYVLHEDVFYPNTQPAPSFAYSDGEEFEQNILSVIENAVDRTLFSEELLRAISDWRTACHFSPIRANILRPIEKLCKKRTLELGSGCGIITRYLGELGGDVVALEASATRAKITRSRTQDLNNVKVVCQRIEQFKGSDKFNVVTLIGVLQYARMFSAFTENAEKELLQYASDQLTDDGILVIAIQNKLGLKYFSGYPEANVNLPFYGIENQYARDGIVRFSAHEIKKLLEGVGLSHQMMLLPLPDYHMPVSILNPEAIRGHEAFSVENFLSLTTSRDRLRPDWIKPTFSLEKAWESIHQAGLTESLANSFLMIAAKNTEAIASVKKIFPDLACHYSVERKPAFACLKRFIPQTKGIVAERSLLLPQSCSSTPEVHRVGTEVYIPGKLWWSRLVTIINGNSWNINQIADWARPWIDLILSHADKDKHRDTWQLEDSVAGYLFDLTPINCIEKADGTLEFIDKEWELGFPLTLSYILIRGLFGSLTTISSCAKPAASQSIQITHLVTDILKINGFNISSEDIENYCSQELYIQRLIINQNAYQGTEEVWRNYILTSTLACRNKIYNDSVSSVEYNSLNTRFNDVTRELTALKKSYSWQLTKPLRLVKRVLSKLNQNK